MLSNIRGLIALVLAVALTIVAAVLTGGGGGGTGPTTTSSSSTSTSMSSTTSSIPGSTTSTSSGSTTSTSDPGATTTTTVGGGEDAASVRYTRIRVVIDNQAQWFTATLTDTTIEQIRVVAKTGATQVTSLGPAISVSGIGSATVDMVLRIDDDAAPILKTCKNYLAPTTITLRRLTDGNVTVASVTNSGHSGSVPPGGCENALDAPVSRTDLVGPTRWPARADPRQMVLAFYYPWWDHATVDGRDFGDNPTGPFDTSDPAEVAEALDLAAAHGIDGFLSEYAGYPDDNARTDLVYQAAEARGDFQMALVLDFEILYARGHDVTAAEITAELNAVARWADSPAQLEIGGQPVVFLYGTNRVDPQMWQTGVAQLLATTGLRPFFVDQSNRLAAQGTYFYGNGFLNDRSALLTFGDAQLQNYRLIPGLTGQPTRLLVMPVQPGYDDTRGDKPNPWSVDRADGQRYQDSFDAAMVALPDWLVVSTWNEYAEQTFIMPGEISGTRALEQTSDFAATFHGG